MIDIIWKGPSGLTPYGLKKEGDIFQVEKAEFEMLKKQKMAVLKQSLKKVKEKTGDK